jgi:hypothetical protein
MSEEFRKITESEYKDQQRVMRSKVLNSPRGMTPQMCVVRGDKAVGNLAQEYEQNLAVDLDHIQDLFQKLLKNKDGFEPILDKMYEHANNVRGEGGTFGYKFLSRVADNLCHFIEFTKPYLGAEHRDRLLKAYAVHLDSLKLSEKNLKQGEINKEQALLLDRLREMQGKFRAFLKNA